MHIARGEIWLQRLLEAEMAAEAPAAGRRDGLAT
jgi:hypothetical protein